MADLELRKLRSDLGGLISKAGIPQTASTEGWHDALSSNISSRKGPAERHSIKGSEKIPEVMIRNGTGDRWSAAPKTPVEQQQVSEELDGPLLHRLDTLAFGIVQSLQAEVRQLVSLLIDQRNSESASTAAAAESANAFGLRSTGFLDSDSLLDHPATTLQKKPIVTTPPQQWLQNEGQQNSGQTKSQYHGGTDRAVSTSPVTKPDNGSSGLTRRKSITVASHRIILTDPAAPKAKSVTEPTQFESPDSEVASGATPADMKSCSAHRHLQLRRTKSEFIQPSRAKLAVGNMLGGFSYSSKDTENPSLAASPHSTSHVQQVEICSLPSSSLPSNLLLGVSCRAEIVVAGPTEQRRPATLSSEYRQLGEHDHDLVQEESVRGENVFQNSLDCRQDRVLTSEKEQAQAAVAEQQGPQQGKHYPKGRKPQETVSSKHRPVRQTDAVVKGLSVAAAAATEVGQPSPSSSVKRGVKNHRLSESTDSKNWPTDSNTSVTEAFGHAGSSSKMLEQQKVWVTATSAQDTVMQKVRFFN